MNSVEKPEDGHLAILGKRVIHLNHSFLRTFILSVSVFG
jgi:hypothetical protein